MIIHYQNHLLFGLKLSLHDVGSIVPSQPFEVSQIHEVDTILRIVHNVGSMTLTGIWSLSVLVVCSLISYFSFLQLTYHNKSIEEDPAFTDDDLHSSGLIF